MLTIITAAERPPQVIGFKLLDDYEMPLAPIDMETERHDELVAAPLPHENDKAKNW